MINILKKTDVILIGASIMSATLGALLKELAPEWEIKVFEKLTSAGKESSNVWNNAGTGHSALCELNYVSERPYGSTEYHTTEFVFIGGGGGSLHAKSLGLILPHARNGKGYLLEV